MDVYFCQLPALISFQAAGQSSAPPHDSTKCWTAELMALWFL